MIEKERYIKTLRKFWTSRLAYRFCFVYKNKQVRFYESQYMPMDTIILEDRVCIELVKLHQINKFGSFDWNHAHELDLPTRRLLKANLRPTLSYDKYILSFI